MTARRGHFPDGEVSVTLGRVAHDSLPPVGDLSAYRRARQESSAEALICLFSQVLGKPLSRRELTPFEHARRENRLRERQRRFS